MGLEEHPSPGVDSESIQDDATLDDARRVPANDQEARAWLDGLMRTYGQRIVSYYQYKLRDEELAKDLLIECFYQAWRSRKSFRGDAKASTWLWTISRRVLAAHFEKKKRRANEVLTEEMPEASEDGRETLSEQQARRQALLACLGELSELVQRSVELVWLLGHSFVEAAELLDEKPDSVRMRLKRARKPLQRCLSEKGVVGVM